MAQLVIFDMEWNMGYQPKTFRYQGVEQTLRGEVIQIKLMLSVAKERLDEAAAPAAPALEEPVTAGEKAVPAYL